LDLCISGALYDVNKALKIGLIDEILKSSDSEDILKEAKNFSISHPKSKKLAWNLMDKVVRNTDLGRALIYNQVIKQLNSRTKLKYPAPYWILEILLESCETSLLSAVEMEIHAFEKLLKTSMAKKLTRLFIVQDKLKKLYPNPTSWIIPKEYGIIGGGMVGTAFAHILLLKGYSVILIAKDETKASKKIEFLLKFSEDSHQLKKGESVNLLKNLKISTSISSLNDVDFFIESINESLESKQNLISELKLKENSILTSTSSTLISSMDTIGLHLMYPFHRIPIAEIIVKKDTKEEDIEKIFKFAREIGKIPVVLNGKSIISNLLGCLFCETLEMVSAGYPITVIQKEIRDADFTIQIVDLMGKLCEFNLRCHWT
jgi:hypothetical protein